MNRLQFMGAFLFYLFLSSVLSSAGFIVHEVIESNVMTCQQTSIDYQLEPNGPTIGTFMIPDCQSPFPQDSTSLTLTQKNIAFALNLLLAIIFIYPVSCLCAKRFHDIGFNQYIPFSLMMPAEMIDQFLFIFVNYKNNVSLSLEAIIIILCLLLPTKLSHKSVSTSNLIS